MELLEKFEPFIENIFTNMRSLFLRIKDCQLLRDINSKYLATSHSIPHMDSHDNLQKSNTIHQ